MRLRVLKGHFELYKCCQGTVTDVDCSASCPQLCLMLEACFCTYVTNSLHPLCFLLARGTLMIVRTLLRVVGAPHQCLVGSVASCLIYADSRFNIPMTQRNVRYCAVIATRGLLAHQRKLLADPTDNKIQRYKILPHRHFSHLEKTSWRETTSPP